MNVEIIKVINSGELSVIIKNAINNLAREASLLSHVDAVEEIIFIVKKKEVIIGIIVSYLFYGSLLIDLLWIKKRFRNKGIGTNLVLKMENYAQDKGVKFSIVTTMDWWKNSKFYEKLSYEIEYKRSGYQDNSTLYSYIKKF